MTSATTTPAPRPGRRPADDLVLASKLTAPRLPGWMVARPRLDQRINEGTAGPLTVVTGPPGAGKTMALASWAAASVTPVRVAWVTLDNYDNQPGSFWSSVVKALQQVGVPLKETVPPLPQTGAIGRAFLLRLASALAALDPPLVLVLDDLHLLTAPEPLAELDYMLRYARPGLRLVAAARIDPRLPLHRHRLAGELTEIRAADLAFTGPEANLLMAQHGVTLPAGSVDLITEQVDGWAAGLRLAALSLDGHPDPGLFIKNLAAEDNALTSYLVDEVLDAQPSAQRELMLRTSILDRVSADLASELTGDEQAGRTLAALARSGAFVQPLGHGWYRYHPLLTDVLRLKLRLESPDRTPVLHRQAARWYQHNGPLGKAVAHAAAVNDWPLAARIVVDELATGELLKPRGSSPVAGTLRRMAVPGALLDGSTQAPSLLAAAALELGDGRDKEAGRLLAAAGECLDRLPADHEIPSRLAAAMLRLAAARRCGDFDAARTADAQAEALFEQLPPSLRSRHPEAQGQVMSGRGVVEFWAGDPGPAAVAFAGAAAALPESSSDQAACNGHLALIEALRGRLSHAATLAAPRINPAADAQARLPAPSAAVALALVHLERNELDASRSRLKQADAALRTDPDRMIGAVACLVAARGALAQDNGPAAVDLIQRGRDSWAPPPWLDHLLTMAEAQASTAIGDIQAALDAARRAGTGSGLDAAVARARAFLAAGNLHAARQALPVGADAPTGEADDRLEAHLTDALISYRSHDRARGRRSLERALRLAEPERRRLPLAMNQSWIQPALHYSPDLARVYRGLLQPGAGRRGEVAFRLANGSHPDPVIVEQLSDREREVLRFAAAMLSTYEIADSMYLSVNTVKTHFKSIFRKLGATRRGEAVRRAKKLGLI
jgi:LuxR family transcriptional regulator, maltose regulon positive regulatory protein